MEVAQSTSSCGGDRDISTDFESLVQGAPEHSAGQDDHGRDKCSPHDHHAKPWPPIRSQSQATARRMNFDGSWYLLKNGTVSTVSDGGSGREYYRADSLEILYSDAFAYSLQGTTSPTASTQEVPRYSSFKKH